MIKKYYFECKFKGSSTIQHLLLIIIYLYLMDMFNKGRKSFIEVIYCNTQIIRLIKELISLCVWPPTS
jgi:hypothetical protein